MSQEILLGRQGFVRNAYVNAIDTSFTQLVPPPPPVEEVITVEEFFNLYQTLFYEIPAEGSVNSHTYLIERSKEYIGFTEENDENIQILLDEITQLREELLATQKELQDVQLSAIEENQAILNQQEQEERFGTSELTPGTQITAQPTSVVGVGGSGGSY
jgi:hypothetical protein